MTRIAYLHDERLEVRECTKHISPVIEDGRGRFPEDLRVKAPRGARAAIAAAAQIKHTTHSEYVRQAILRCLDADGVKLRRGMVEITKAELIGDVFRKTRDVGRVLTMQQHPDLLLRIAADKARKQAPP